MYSYVFGVAKFESEVKIGPSGHNFFLTTKTCFDTFIFFQAQFCSKSSEKIHRSVFKDCRAVTESEGVRSHSLNV